MECEVSKQRAVVWWWYTVSSQSLGEKWAGWLASRGRNEGGEWLPRAKPKAQLNGHKSCLVVSTSRARRIS